MVNTNNKIASILKVNRDLISLSQHKENRRRVWWYVFSFI